MELRYDDSFRSVDDEGPSRGHVRNIAEIYILYADVKVLVFRIAAGKTQLGFQRHIVCQTSLETFIY